MNEQFRVAQKIGLMFHHDTHLPEDVKSWAISQLHSKSPALGVSNSFSKKIEEWPQSLQPNLEKRDDMFSLYKMNRHKEKEKREGQESPKAVQENYRKNLMGVTDELKFAHRNVHGKDQVKLRFTSFWANHFTTGNIHDNQNHIGHAIEKAILANLNGNFDLMLYKVTSHPAMLVYLDNIWSAGENSAYARNQRAQNQHAGLNDNLGRELLELHTVSPSAKYTETDIKNAAKVLAGWGTATDFKSKNELIRMGGTTNTWDFFKKDYAEPGVKNVMGKTINQGKGGLREMTNFLAAHDHTVNHISTKLAQHFVSDNPSTTDINYIKDAWKKSNGNLDKIHVAVIERAILSKEPKFQWPMTWFFQVLRLSNASFLNGWNQRFEYSDSLMRNKDIFIELGQGFWHTRQPNGYSSDKNEWISGEMFERRIRFAEAIYKKGRPRFKAQEIMDRIGANDTTRKLVASAGGSQLKQFIALMCSPEIMGLEDA
jgi:uncharacterized protein (DUF1800 family)